MAWRSGLWTSPRASAASASSIAAMHDRRSRSSATSCSFRTSSFIAVFLQHDGSIMRVMSTWPALPLEEWVDTRNTLHRWTQVVGKIRLALTPLVNHWWNVPLYVTARGLTTSTIPYGDRWFDMEFDFIAHVLRVRSSDGAEHDIPLGPRSVADLHDEVFSVLKSLRIVCEIWTTPVEIATNAIPLDRDEHHRSYDRESVDRFWQILALTDAVFTRFRSEFKIGRAHV